MIASTMKSQRGKPGGGIGPEETLIAETVRSHPRPGSNSNGNLVASTLKAQRGKDGGGLSHEETLVAHDGTLAVPLPELPREDGAPCTGLSARIAAPLSHGSNPNSNMAGRRREDDENLVTAFHMLQDPISEPELTPAWGKSNKEGTASLGIQRGASVRRLTPTECERLQALSDGWTLVPDTAPDSRRYAALGDAVTANVAEWIGRRLIGAA